MPEQPPAISAARFHSQFDGMAATGATSQGGVHRLAASSKDGARFLGRHVAGIAAELAA